MCGPPGLQVKQKMDRFVPRLSNPLAEAVDALVALWDQYNPIYYFPPSKFYCLRALQY